MPQLPSGHAGSVLYSVQPNHYLQTQLPNVKPHVFSSSGEALEKAILPAACIIGALTWETETLNRNTHTIL